GAWPSLCFRTVFLNCSCARLRLGTSMRKSRAPPAEGRGVNHYFSLSTKGFSMPVTVGFLLFLKPEAALPGHDHTVSPDQPHVLASEMIQRLMAVARAADALRREGWHLCLHGYEVAAWHAEIHTKSQARERLKQLGIEPQIAACYVEEDDV